MQIRKQSQTNQEQLEGFLQLGKTYYNKKKYAQAIASFDEALRIDPQNIQALEGRGTAYYRKPNLDATIVDFDHLLEVIGSDDAKIYSKTIALANYYLGRAYHKKNELVSAMDYLKTAMKFDDKRAFHDALAQVYLDKGLIHYDRKNFVDAEKFLKACCKHCRDIHEFKTEAKKYLAFIKIDAANKEMEAKDIQAHPYKIDIKQLTFSQQIGEGSFAKVYRGKFNQETIAVKYLTFKDPIDHTVFKDERDILLLLAKANALNVVTLKAYSITHISYALVMEFMAGGTLTASLGKLSLPKKQQIIMDISIGVDSLHNNNIIHRDIKPDNILLTATWEAKISDFGLSCITKDNGYVTECVGTPMYHAPEILTRSEPYNESIDVYSMSHVFWNIMTGIPLPYVRSSIKRQADLIDWVATKQNREKIPELCPQNIKFVIENGWLHEASKRLTAKQVLAELKKPEVSESAELSESSESSESLDTASISPPRKFFSRPS